jgi:hypothetical protein
VNGKTKPPLALVKLLIVLDRHPKLLDEVRAGRSLPPAAAEKDCRSVYLNRIGALPRSGRGPIA